MDATKTSIPSWQNFLEIRLNPPSQNNSFAPPRTCLVGVGNDLRGDDSAALAAAREIIARGSPCGHFLALEGGPAPENITAVLRGFQPERVIFLDAAHMDEPPGTIRWIELNTIDGMSTSSHSLPLSILAEFIEMEFGCAVHVLGIQPAQNEVGEALSEPVRRAVDEIVEAFTSAPSP